MDNLTKKTHHGHAIKRFRHTLGIKQEALAADLGISQAMVSTYESKKVLDDDVVEKIAKILGVDPLLIQGLEEDPVTVIVENNKLDNHSIAVNNIAGDHVINNPIDKIAELFERLLEKEQEKIALLEKLLKERV